MDMVSDERMVGIDRLISEGLNEDAQLAKVNDSPIIPQRASAESWNQGGGLAAMNAKVYAVKVSHSVMFRPVSKSCPRPTTTAF